MGSSAILELADPPTQVGRTPEATGLIRVFGVGVAVIGRTQGMVTQNFDDPAIGNLAARALHDHTLEFGFQRRQARKAAFDFDQLGPCDGICGGAGLVRPV